MERRKPKLLIIGHARHGKDTVAEMVRDTWGLTFISSSLFVGEEIIWPLWGKDRYPTFDEMFEDRVNHRSTWFNLIAAYNTPDLTKTATTMIERGYDIYVGMRRKAELQACATAKIFDKIIWVEATKREPLEKSDSMELNQHMADIVINNNGTWLFRFCGTSSIMRVSKSASLLFLISSLMMVLCKTTPCSRFRPTKWQ
jgi:hypothetical protein